MKMKKTGMMKKLAIAILVLASVFSLIACGSESTESNTVATKLRDAFLIEMKDTNDIGIVAAKLTENKIFDDMSMGTMQVDPGYLTGFDAEINNFTEGVMFSPMIGSIPFVGYVFTTDDPEALEKSLKEHAQLNWNICTVADEMVVETNGNHVFFVMAPNSFEE